MNVRALLTLVGVVGTVGAYAACSSDPVTTDGDAGSTPTGTTTTTAPKPTSTTTSTTTAPTPDSSVPDSSAPDASASDASTDSGADASDGATAATWTAVHAIITNRCGNTCHLKANNPSGNLRLDDKAMAYTNLVDANASTACGAVGKRVVKSNAAQSKLYIKVSSPTATIAACGNRMPNGGAMLPAAEIAAFQSWINAGAPNN
jgi:hypothetical protein